MKSLRLAPLIGLGLSLIGSAAAEDWPQWRGPERDGVSAETGLLKEWPAAGPRRVLTITGLGAGFSAPAVAGGRVYLLGTSGKDEVVIALEAATGKRVFTARLGPAYSNGQGDGPRSTPTVDGDRLYALGASGDLACLESATGKPVWSLNLLARFRASKITWGLSESPLVVLDRVLVNAGGRGASIVALDKQTGAVLWTSQDDEAGYSSAVAFEAAGVLQAAFFTGRRALGVRVSDGKLLWDDSKVSNTTANIATPVVRGNRVFVSSDYGTGAALLEISGTPAAVSARELYFTSRMRNHYGSSVLLGETLYGFSSTLLTALRFGDGELLWRDRSVGKGSLTAADGRLYLFGQNGVAALVEATPEAYRERGRFRIEPQGPTYAPPVVANGRLYLRDQDTLYVYDVREAR